MPDVTAYARQIEQLERELDEMTAALSQAWDQLVPFLQEAPPQAESAQDIVPIIQAVIAAADTEMGGVYLFQPDEWLVLPGHFNLPEADKARLRAIEPDQTLSLMVEGPECAAWAFVPVMSEGVISGVLGIGTFNLQRSFNAVELRIIVRMAERVGSQIAAAQLARSREREAALQREMQIANEIQQSIQPEKPPYAPGLHVGSYWRPALQVGGDAWGWVMQPNGRLAWFILDVSGKGLPAALAAVSLHTAIRMALRMQLPPAEVLSVINAEFYDAYTLTGLMATVAIVAHDADSGTLQLANAGHPPVLVRQASGWLHLEATAPPVGVLPELDAEPQIVQLEYGDLILCYSDGFSEIETEQGLWGEAGLLGALPATLSSVEDVVDHIVAASKQAGQARDDQTLVVALCAENAER